MREALAEAKNRLGDDAAVLHAKQFEEPSFFGLAKKRGVEVLLAVDDGADPDWISLDWSVRRGQGVVPMAEVPLGCFAQHAVLPPNAHQRQTLAPAR